MTGPAPSTNEKLKVPPRGKPQKREDRSTMTMTDPIADMLTRLRNANQAYHDDGDDALSKLKQGLAEILQQEGYITSYEVASPPRAPSARR